MVMGKSWEYIYIWIYMGIPGLVICSRLRTGKWHMKTSLMVIYLEDHPGGESLVNHPFVGYPIYQWSGKLWHKIFAAVRSVGWSSKNGSETRSLAKKNRQMWWNRKTWNYPEILRAPGRPWVPRITKNSIEKNSRKKCHLILVASIVWKSRTLQVPCCR